MQFIFKLTILLLLSALTLGGIPSERASFRPGQDYALFFAVHQYQHGALSDLPNTIPNARAIAEELKKSYGFQTEVVENPTYQRIEDKISEYRRRFQSGRYARDGQLLVFFAGHGMKEDNTGYFLPADADPDRLYRTALDYDTWRSKISAIDCKHILAAVDACYSVTFDPNWRNMTPRRKGEYTENQKLLSNHQAFRARLFFTSDAKEDTTPGRSNFARKFLEGLRLMRGRDGFFTAGELFSSYIEKATPPTHSGDFERDEPGSSFLFFHSGPTVDPQEQMLWDLAREQASREAYGFYLQRYPKGQFADAAQKALDALNNDLPQDGLILIKGGTFEMGDQFGDGSSNEKPVHTVSVNDFYMGQYEVTVEEFSRFINATKYQTDAEKGGGSYAYNSEGRWGKQAGVNWRHNEIGKLRPSSEYNHPVIYVSWNDAVAYCNWLSQQNGYQPVYRISGNTVKPNWQANGYRLPTEAEWEYAARSGGQREKWAGASTESQLSNYANYYEGGAKGKDGYVYTAPVGSFSPNGAQLHDMSGNVWEWCWDWYDSDYYAKRSNANNPKGSTSGSYRVLRGGSWNSPPAYVRCANRDDNFLDLRRGNIGFRLSRAAY